MNPETPAASPLTREQAGILAHTSQNGRYVTEGEPAVSALAQAGLLHDHGPQTIAGGMHCFTLTPNGRQALQAHRHTLPKPKPPTRSQSRYRRYRHHRDAGCNLSFREWLKAFPKDPHPALR